MAGSFRKLGDTNYEVTAGSKEYVLSERALGNGTGKFTIVLTADGYEDLIFKVNDGKLVEDTVKPVE